MKDEIFRCRPTWYAANITFWVIVKNSSPQPTVGRQMAVCQPTVGRLSADSRPTGYGPSVDGRQSAERWPTVGDMWVMCR